MSFGFLGKVTVIRTVRALARFGFFWGFS